jgi:hypothetical protein
MGGDLGWEREAEFSNRGYLETYNFVSNRHVTLHAS